MDIISTTANSVWRDYVTDGDAGSGVHEPVKSEIRSLFGVVGQSIMLTPTQYDAVADGVSDDAAYVQDAIDVAAALTSQYGPTIFIFLNGEFGIGTQLELAGAPNVMLIGGKLTALAGIGSSDYLLHFGDGTVGGRPEGGGIRDCFVECNLLCNGIFFDNNKNAFIDHNKVHGFIDYGIRVTGSGGNNTVERNIVHKYNFGETGYDVWANRTGIWHQHRDRRLQRELQRRRLLPIPALPRHAGRLQRHRRPLLQRRCPTDQLPVGHGCGRQWRRNRIDGSRPWLLDRQCRGRQLSSRAS